STGKSHRDFPEPPADLASRPDRERWLEFQAIIHRACQADLRGRYATAEAMLADIERLGVGKSVRRAHRSEKHWHLTRKAGAWFVGAAGVFILFAVAGRLNQPPANPEATNRSTNKVAQDQYDSGRSFYRINGDLESAATNFGAAAKADPNFLLAQAAFAASL